MDKMVEKFLKEVENTSWEILRMSIKNCHTYGLDSIVLENNNGILRRVFIARKDHLMYNKQIKII